MPRVKRSVHARKKRRKVLEQAKGYYGRKSTHYRYAKEQVEHSLVYAYRDRRNKKRNFRSLWIVRINAAARANGLSYNQLMNGAPQGGDRARPQVARRPRRRAIPPAFARGRRAGEGRAGRGRVGAGLPRPRRRTGRRPRARRPRLSAARRRSSTRSARRSTRGWPSARPRSVARRAAILGGDVGVGRRAAALRRRAPPRPHGRRARRAERATGTTSRRPSPRTRSALRRWMAEQGVQTNEVQRCIGAAPAFLTIAAETGLPLELLELGPSAGLNLELDRYRYVYAEGTWGDPAAPLDARRGRGGPRARRRCCAARCAIRRRRGVDLAPVDATTDEGLTLLRAFLWPGPRGSRPPPRRRGRRPARRRERPGADPRRLRRTCSRRCSPSDPTTRSPSSSRPPRPATCPRGARADRRRAGRRGGGRPPARLGLRPQAATSGRASARTPGSSSCASGRRRCATSRTSTSTATGSTGSADERHPRAPGARHDGPAAPVREPSRVGAAA